MNTNQPHPDAYKSALHPIYKNKNGHQVSDLAVITKISATGTAKNERQFKTVEFQYVIDLNSSAAQTKKGFVRNIWGPLVDKNDATKVIQPADALWDRKFPLHIYNAEGKAVAHPKANLPMLAIGELVPIAQTQFDTTEYSITSKGFDGVERTNKVKKLTVICFDSENPLAVANSRMNGRVLDRDGVPTGNRLSGYVTGITTEEGEFIAIAPPPRVTPLTDVVNEGAPTAESFKPANVKEEEKIGA